MSNHPPTKVPFNFPYMTGKELGCIEEARANGRLAGDGPFTKLCHDWLETCTGSRKALLTHSCTAALEMAALLLRIEPGDEVIMPSYTFVSTANAFVLRGATPVFVDIREDTLNLDEEKVESAITRKTKAIVAVHYAGVACNMNRLMTIALEYGLHVVEDAAQGMLASYQGNPLGSIGHLGAFSFHETKNVISGEGGALLVNNSKFIERAEIIREKGTDRSRFFRGEIDKYTWQDIGSSFLPGELTAAFLWAQLQEASQITTRRIASWRRYHRMLEPLESAGLLRRPIVPGDCIHNGHLYYVLLPSERVRDVVLNDLKENAISAFFHYVPLHSAPAGILYGRAQGKLKVTDWQASRLIRLPLFADISEEQQNRVVNCLAQASRAN
jgi:dTDP-4-amino-4,6-dideoxygalactose transaminase